MANSTLHTAAFSERAGLIDERQGIIHGMSVLEIGEAKGHGTRIDAKSLETALAASASHKDGVLSKADHGSGIFEVIGLLKNFRIDGPKLRADLHLLKSHPRFASIIEMARTAPNAAGMSISFSYVPEVIKEEVYIRVKSLFTVDLVDCPAATSGFFSTKPVDDETLAKLAAEIWGEAVVQSARGSDFSSIIRRRFVYGGLSVPGLDPKPIIARFGEVRAPFGLDRISRDREQKIVNDFFSGKANPESKRPALPENLRGLERTKAAFAAQMKN